MAEERVQRRLAAILAADVVGYSRLIRADEDGTLARLKALRDELIDPSIARHDGRIVKTMGDGVLVEFSSVVDAVRSAVEVQQSVAEREGSVPEERRIVFRVGINLGDVVIDGDDIHGDGVNVAARLEGLAKPGSICVSGAVHDQVRDRVDLTFEDLGEQEVKNIDRPIRVWRWTTDTSATASGPATTDQPLPLPDKPSIAVLPFENMSGDPEQEYFADGITEDIITGLSKSRSLFVIARNSTFVYKGRSVDVTDVARKLGVQYVLEGSMRKAGDRVRITAQLIDATTGNHVWAERYDRELDDMFALQDEITVTIAGNIDTELATSERERALRKPPSNLRAWELYHRGMWHLYKYTAEDNRKGRQFFHSALEQDPSFASCHAALSYLSTLDVLLLLADDADKAVADAVMYGEQAVQLDHRDGFTHYALGRAYRLVGKRDRAIAEAEKSVEVNPNLAMGHYGLGANLYWFGRAEEAIAPLDMAIRLSPQDPHLYAVQSFRAHAFYALKNYDQTLAAAQEAMNFRPQEFWAYGQSAAAMAQLGRDEDARSACQDFLRQKPEMTAANVRQALRNLHPPYLDHFVAGLRKAGLPE